MILSAVLRCFGENHIVPGQVTNPEPSKRKKVMMLQCKKFYRVLEKDFQHLDGARNVTLDFKLLFCAGK